MPGSSSDQSQRLGLQGEEVAGDAVRLVKRRAGLRPRGPVVDIGCQARPTRLQPARRPVTVRDGARSPAHGARRAGSNAARPRAPTTRPTSCAPMEPVAPSRWATVGAPARSSSSTGWAMRLVQHDQVKSERPTGTDPRRRDDPQRAAVRQRHRLRRHALQARLAHQLGEWANTPAPTRAAPPDAAGSSRRTASRDVAWPNASCVSNHYF